MDIGEGGTCRWTPVLTLDGYPSLVFMKTAVLWAPNESFPTSPRPLGFGTVMAVDSSTPRVLVRIGADPRTGPTSMRYMDVDLLYADGSGFPYTPPIPPGPPRIPPAGGLGGGSSIVGFSVSDSCVFDGTNFVDVLQFFPCDVPTLFASRNYVQGGFLGNDRWGSPAQGWNDRHIIAFDVDANMEYDSIGSNGAGWGGSDEVGTPQLGALQLTKFSGNAADWEASQHRGRGSVAANLPLAAGAVFYDEIFTDPGPLKHGFMLNVMRNRGASLRLDTGVLDFSQAWCVYPASGCDGTGGPNLPPEGARLRLLDDNALRAVKHPITGAPMPIDLSVQYPSAGGWTVYQIKYMRALQEYGLMVVDSALPVDFIGRGALDPSGIYDARWAVVNAPGISQASSQTLAREWYYMFTADASIGGTLAPAWPLNIWHFEMLTLGIRSFDPARTPQIVFGDPHPPIAPGTPPIC